ncbi:MAG TPA: hypothetical protein GXZ78_01770 [Eubacteriaceae bacterium]|jgi:hypothetical protein|nr:hypothetical protein [Eubacteriaceae bacterium]
MDNIAILIAGIIGSVGSYWISLYLNKGATMGAALMTLLSGLVFPNLPFIEPALGATLAVVSTTGAYAGMISKKNVPNIVEMVVIGVFVGTISILAMTTYSGVGGKLGTMAAISCLAWLGIKKVFKIGAVGKKEEEKA